MMIGVNNFSDTLRRRSAGRGKTASVTRTQFEIHAHTNVKEVHLYNCVTETLAIYVGQHLLTDAAQVRV